MKEEDEGEYMISIKLKQKYAIIIWDLVNYLMLEHNEDEDVLSEESLHAVGELDSSLYDALHETEWYKKQNENEI